jgi:hypothetical protein
MDSKKRTERETIEWQAVCAQYKAARDAGWDGVIERGHPLEQWVHKQRRLHKMGRLLDWKRQALREANFDFVSPRQQATTTNEQYAHQLVAFFLKEGHWSPTQTAGGAGLTKWWKAMSESGGRVGVISQSTESAQEAARILRERIPGFSFRTPTKAQINRSRGLSFNGFAKTAPTTIWERDPDVLAARRYGRITQQLALGVCPSYWCTSGDMPVYQIIERASMFCQAVSVEVSGGEAATRHWLVAVSHEGEDGLYLRIEDEQTQRPRTILVDLQTLGSSGYSSDGGRFETCVRGKGGERLRLSYDAFLADQTVRLDTDRLDYDPALRVLTPNVNWEEWLEGRGPERRHTALTTSNRDFNKRMGELQRFIYEARAMHGPAYVPHLSWKNEFSHYKFIEHMVLKRREGKLKFSHAERLMAIPATWGKNETPLHDIVGRFIEWH